MIPWIVSAVIGSQVILGTIDIVLYQNGIETSLSVYVANNGNTSLPCTAPPCQSIVYFKDSMGWVTHTNISPYYITIPSLLNVSKIINLCSDKINTGNLLQSCRHKNDPSFFVCTSNYDCLDSVTDKELEITQNRVAVYPTISNNMYITEITYFGLLILFFTIWISWTINWDKDERKTISKIVYFSMIIADAVTFGAAIKVNSILNNDNDFFPDSLEILLGNNARTYCVCFVAISVGIAAFICFILLLLIIQEKDAPDFILRYFDRNVYWSRMLTTHQLTLLVILRFTTETIIMSSLHITTPESLGNGFANTIGISLGLGIAFIVGRDVYLSVKMFSGLYYKIAMWVIGLLFLTHAAIFMAFPIIYEVDSLTFPINIMFAVALILQATAFGTSRGYETPLTKINTVWEFKADSVHY